MKMRRKLMRSAFNIAAILAAITFSAAPGCSEAQSHDHEACGPAAKANRGVKNILFGWTDIPKSIIEVTRDSGNPVFGLTGGTLKGVGKAFPRTVSGISDVLSSPMDDGGKLRPDELNKQLR